MTVCTVVLDYCIHLIFTCCPFTTGKRENHGEDRIVSTAMAVNTLLYTWMDGDKFLPTTPSSVLKTVMNGTEWLVRNALSGKYKPLNVLFSGSVKTADVSI